MTELDRLQHVLETSFSLSAFREGQRDIIDAILQGQDVVAVMPTGGGKSLCYQLPALILPGLTVVVSPLIALMKDQVDSLLARGLRATYINSTLSPEEQTRRLAQATHGQIKLLYVAPERFRSLQFTRTLAGIDVSLFAVDEAHCLSQWGHDFRPDYLRLGQAIAALGRPPIAAFTATATVEVREDIARNLNLVEPVTFFAGVDRDNLFLEFNYFSGKGGQEQKMQTMLRTIQKHRGATGIVYASTRKNVEKVYERLKQAGVTALPYHAGMDDDARAQAQDLFMGGRVQVIVATNAFGMGVDKSDIRYVIHHDFPGSIEAYYQEVGRAGRDGKPARCLTLFSESDRFVQEFFHQGSNPPREVIEEVHRILSRHDEDTVELTVADITSKMRGTDNEMAVSTAMKVLERFGVISRGFRGESRAFVRARRPWEEVLQALARAPVQRAVADALPGAVAGDMNVGAEIDLGALAYEAGVDREQVSRVLLELQRGGHLEYEPPFRGRTTRVLQRDTALTVDWTMLEKKAQRDSEKIDLMMAFARSEACRKWFLRRYFMDDGGKAWCGSCDRCAVQTAEEAESAVEHELKTADRMVRAREGKGAKLRKSAEKTSKSLTGARAASRAVPPARPLEGDALVLVQKVLSCVARMRGRFGRIKIAQVLKGSREKDVLRWDLDKLSTYGLLADLKLEDISAVIDALMSAGLLQTSTISDEGTHKVAVIELAEKGRQVMMGRESAYLLLPSGVMPGSRGGRVSEGRALEPSSSGLRSAARGSSWVHPQAAEPSEEGEEGRPFSSHIYDAICRWRNQRAKAEGVPPYQIMHNRTAQELARVRPMTPEALRRVKGMGPTRCVAFGEDLLAIILEQVRLDPGI